MIRKLALVPAVVVIVFAGACTTRTDDTTSSAPSRITTGPSIAANVPPTSSQVNKGRARVERDPCTDLSDEAVEAVGFDHLTRQRIDRIFDSYSFVGCQFDHEERDQFEMMTTTRTLQVYATNLTLDEFRGREGAAATPAQVNGRAAITYTDPSAEACYTVIETSYGTLDISKSVASVFTQEKPCDNMQEIASAIDTSMPD
ncbi:DUF3558 domain-containing protein [Nocardia sp. NPDC050799]|uniref:DUF3558 domain-containing protein n=1 Tax=Nocardia sp. NPDC050799 TaxID=3154842 RepID=UPI0033DCB539